MSGVVVAVVGPTATGKSELGLALAERLGGEVVNADAMQLYRGMDIGTAKLPPAQRRGIVHHQIDVLDVDEEASVAAYQRDARGDLTAIGGRAVVVGGSGLYLRALLDEMEIPPTDPRLRAELEARLAGGVGPLLAELAAADPVAAQRIGPNPRRVVRALEVLHLTGQVRSELPPYRYHVPTLQIGLDLPTAELDRRIEARVDRMWELGLVAEVRDLAPRLGRTASRALGYAEVLAMLRGDLTEAEARDAVKAGTRRLARRQMRWFGRDPRIHWLSGDPAAALELVAAADAGNLPEPGGGRRRLGP